MAALPHLAKAAGLAFLWSSLSIGCGGASSPSGAAAPATPVAAGICAPTPTSTRIVNVMEAPYGAKGDGLTDDSLALQNAVNAVAGTGGTVRIPAGTYLVNPVANNNAGLRLGSHMTLHLESGAVLQAMSTATSRHVVLLLSGVQNVNVRGGVVVGNRNHNNITDPDEGGFGIQFMNSRQVAVEGVLVRDCWSDGFYVGGKCQDITLCTVTAEHNRRNGLSITSAEGMWVKGSTFRDNTGSLKGDAWINGFGVNLEPNPGESVARVHVSGCSFTGNADCGIALGPSVANTGKAYVRDVVIDGNTATANGLRGRGAGIGISNTAGHQITNNTLTDNLGTGILLRNQANGNLIKGNSVTGTRAALPAGDMGYGILLYLTGGNAVAGNAVTNSAACGIRDAYPAGTNTIGPNTLSNNHPNQCP